MDKKLHISLRKLLFSMVLAGSLSNAQVTTFPWTETFEDVSPTVSQWTQIVESGSKSWSVVSSAYYGYTTGPYQGTKMAQYDITSFGSDTTKYVSPVLNLSGASGVTLEFKFRNKAWGSDQNIINVYYRTSSSTPWVLISTYDTSVADWESSGVLALPSPSATYQIAIEGVSKYGSSINVDNVMVNASNLGTQELVSKSSIKIYPNPVIADVLNVSSAEPMSELNIFDISGRKLKTLEVRGSNETVKVGDLKSGSYLLQIQNKTGEISSAKFIKK